MTGVAVALGVRPGDLVALVGGGGKTSLMIALGQSLVAAGQRVVLTTTTRIASHELALAPAACPAGDDEALAAALAAVGCCLVTREVGPHKAAGVEPDMPQHWLARPDVDVVVVEADGAAQRPVKLPAAHEPALPVGVTLLVALVGIDALSGPLEQVAHRPERVAAWLGISPEERLTPALLARLAAGEEGGLKGLPAGARAALFINKVEDEQQALLAGQVALAAFAGSPITRVVAGALQREGQPLLVLKRAPGGE